MRDLKSGSAVLVIGKIAKEGTKTDGTEDDIPVRIEELKDSFSSVRAQVKATRGLRERGGDSDDESKCCKHEDGEEGKHILECEKAEHGKNK